ncbi:MAG TPA: neuraminidase-like domain-containing protein [Ktedonobacteraceae bacterium]|nr:neuraminidase-like domain-containing protein [Ktedonobacteraceae bacterium]
MLQRLAITSSDDLSKLLANPAYYGGLDLSQLPVQTAQPALSFSAWLQLAQIMQFKAQYPAPQGVNFLDMLAAAQTAPNQSGILTSLSTLTTWDLTDLQTVDSALALTVADYQKIATYQRLAACFASIQRLGVKAQAVIAWAQQPSSQDISTQIKQATKAKYPNDQWVTIAAPLQDAIRDLKRAALVNYLIAHPDPPNGKNWADANDLFSYFLIDVEMTSCQLSSRIVQATNAIQLFAQRCLMNLEPDITADVQNDPDWQQWQWMKAYRVWEANREVFLYPENWILPELRKNKSSFFKDLESDLLQNQITNDNVETGMLSYLQKLNDVSRLEVSAMYHDDELGILHVFARTHDVPPIYYYRYLKDGAWSGWEKINLDIKSDHLIPVVYNRKLYLFWALFTPKSEKHENQPIAPAQGGQTYNTPPPPNQYWEIQLAWSYLHDGKWIAQSHSNMILIHPQRVVGSQPVSPLRPQFAYTFKAMMRGDDLVINAFISPTIEFNNPIGNYNETGLPWHSSEFVFNSTVTAINVVDINGFQQWIYNNYSADGRAIGTVQQQQSSLLLPLLSHYNNEDLVNISTNGGQLYVLKQSSLRLDNGQLLAAAGLPYEVVVPHQDAQFDSTRPFFYQDKQRAYFITPTILYQNGSTFTPNLPASPYNAQYEVAYQFDEFYHPFTKLFIHELNKLGVPGLFDRRLQTNPGAAPFPIDSFSFSSVYQPTSLVTADNDQEIVDFSPGGAYSLYNWELFFHAPLMLALRLNQNQRFEEAAKWFHYIFDPGSASSDLPPQRYWITKPFQLQTADILNQRIDNLLKLINQHDPTYEAQVTQWRNDPFDPHMIANLRPVAYMKTTVMKYLDMLIAWGDNLFSQDTIETINQATQLYILAAQILGPRPQQLPALQRAADKSFNDLEKDLDAFGNAMTEVENTVVISGDGSSPNPNTPQLPQLQSFYFCIPANSQLLGYWDTVADRLFKIRHCQNIQGVTQQLPLFSPPINPALLVQAAAAGIDLGSILNDITATLPCFRFSELLKRAYSFCKEVQSLGRELLTALEKNDSEGLALLRSSREIVLQNKILAIRNRQVDEANQLIDALNQILAEVRIRQQYYSTRPYMNAGEIIATALAGTAIISYTLGSSSDIIAAIAHLIPAAFLGAMGIGGSPAASVTYGGDNIGKSTGKASDGFKALGKILEIATARADAQGRYQRSKDEWDFRNNEATQEIAHVQSQILAATIHLDVVQKQVEQQNIVVDNTQAVDDFLHNKFTNQDLYSWMMGQISTVYFQAYQLAYAMAKSAEQCFHFEQGPSTTTYIQFGYWDNLHKGLLAGDLLYYDLERMESDYLAQHCRPLEITKIISLAQIAPDRLMLLKETGECDFDLPELLFDLDYPGHYKRRIKLVRITVNCPSTSGAPCSPNVSSTLTMTKNSERISTDLSAGYTRTGLSDTRFIDNVAPVQSIVTSNAVFDSGMFSDTELFKLEVRDGRYMPFEGAGAISSWHLELQQDTNQFDTSSITDVTLTFLYSARDGGSALKTAAKQAVTDALPKNGILLIDAAAKFPTQWQGFLHPSGGTDQILNLAITPQLFPFYARNRTITITQVDLLAQFTPSTTTLIAEFVPPMASSDPHPSLATGSPYDPLLHASITTLSVVIDNSTPQWQLRLQISGAADFKSLPPTQLADVYLLLYFTVS